VRLLAAACLVLSGLCAASLAADQGDTAAILDELAGTKPPAEAGADKAAAGREQVPIENLFQDYLAARSECQDAGSANQSVDAELQKVLREIRRTQYESSAKMRPVREDLGAARARLKWCEQVLWQPEPRKPTYESTPDKPKDDSDVSRQYWERRKKAVEARNSRLKETYERNLDQYKMQQDKAKKEKPDLEKKVKALQAQLDGLEAEHTRALGPLALQRKEVEARQNDARHVTAEAISRLRRAQMALDAAAEPDRLKDGICKWRGSYVRLEELEATYAETVQRIENGRHDMKDVYAARGEDLPADWRHSLQDEADAMKAVIDRAKAAGAE